MGLSLAKPIDMVQILSNSSPFLPLFRQWSSRSFSPAKRLCCLLLLLWPWPYSLCISNACLGLLEFLQLSDVILYLLVFLPLSSSWYSNHQSSGCQIDGRRCNVGFILLGSPSCFGVPPYSSFYLFLHSNFDSCISILLLVGLFEHLAPIDRCLHRFFIVFFF